MHTEEMVFYIFFPRCWNKNFLFAFDCWLVCWSRLVCVRASAVSFLHFSVYCFLGFLLVAARSFANRSWMMSIFFRLSTSGSARTFLGRMHSKCVYEWVACPYERVPIEMLAQYYVKTKTEMISTVCIEWNDKFFSIQFENDPHFIRKMMRTRSDGREVLQREQKINPLSVFDLFSFVFHFAYLYTLTHTHIGSGGACNYCIIKA